MLAITSGLFLGLTEASHISITLENKRRHGNAVEQTWNTISKHIARSFGGDLHLDPLAFGPHNWWYANFTVGESTSLALSIDTASGTLYLNSGLYKPSEKSVDLNRTGQSGFGTWFANGCGTGFFHYSVFKDTVSIGDLVVKNQSFGVLPENPPKYDLPPFPGDGIMGMSVGTDFTAGSSPGWFVNLCDQGQVEEQRFGMALGTQGKGNFVFGGVGT